MVNGVIAMRYMVRVDDMRGNIERFNLCFNRQQNTHNNTTSDISRKS